MAETLFNSIRASSGFVAESAGLEPGRLNPPAVETMAHTGIDISGPECTDIFGLIRSGRSFSQIITVCDETNAERCPIISGAASSLHWSFDDPYSFEGNHGKKTARTIEVRNRICDAIVAWCKQNCGPAANTP